MEITAEAIITAIKDLEKKRPYPNTEGFKVGVDSVAFSLGVKALDLVPKLQEMADFGLAELSHKTQHNSGRVTVKFVRLLEF